MAFEQVTVEARVAEFMARRAAFLADPLSDSIFAARCGGLYSGGVRYVRSDATGAGDGTGNTAATAWTWAQFDTAQSSWPSGVTRVVFAGKFSLASAATAAPSIKIANVLLDFRGAQWVFGRILTNATQISAGETAGEYKIATTAVSNTQPNVFVVVNGKRLGGWSKTSGLGNARAEIASVDTGANTVTFTDLPFALQNGDLCGTNNGTLGGVTHGTALYVVNAGAWADGGQTVQFSLTEGGSAIDLTSYTGPTYVHTLYSGRNNIPAPGTLRAGEFAYVPWLDTVYFRPESALQATDEVVLRQVGSIDGLYITGANVHVLGGEWYCSTTTLIRHNTSAASGGGVWGAVGHACLEGIKAVAAAHVTHYLCEVYDTANQAIGGYTAADGEVGLKVMRNYLHQSGLRRTDFGDFQQIVLNADSHGSYVAHNICDEALRTSDITPWVSEERQIAATGSIVVDNSTDCIVFDNYLRGSTKLLEFSLHDSGVARVKVIGNVFDLRDPPLTEAAFVKGPQCIRMSQSATGTAVGNDVVIAFNLCLLNAGCVQRDGQTTPAGVLMVSSRDTGNALDPAFYNNVIYASALTNAPVFALRRLLADAPWPEVTSDCNVFAGLQWVAARFDEIGGSQPWPATPYTAYATLADWQALSGQDANSLECDAETVSSWYGADGRPIAGSPVEHAGRHLGYMLDLDGRLRHNPPTIGAYEV